MSHKYIYHYTKLSTAIEHILSTKKLLLNSISRSNDPKEYKRLIFNRFVSRETFDKYPDTLKYEEQISKKLREGCKMICFSTGYNPSSNKGRDFFPIKGFALSTMWTHYGDNHRGVCIAIDKEKFINENPEYIQKKYFRVIKYFELPEHNYPELDYEKLTKEGEEIYIEKIKQKYFEFIFFSKSIEWNSEHEFRLIYSSESEQEEYCSIENSIVGVYLGLNANENYIPAIKALCNKQIYKMDFIHDRFVANDI